MSKNCLKCGAEIIKKSNESANYFKTKQYCSISCSKRGQQIRTPNLCIRCGNKIAGYHKRLKYCSSKCYWDDLRDGIGVRKPYKQVKRACKTCGKEYSSLPYQNLYYCSQACSLKFTNITMQNINIGYKKISRVIKPKRRCKTCGKQFEVFPYELKIRACNYCSNVCQIKSIGSLKETSIERKIRKELERRSIPFVAQAQVDNFFADFKIGNIIIECDGIYWHSLPENIERDKRKDKLYKKLGYSVLRLTDKQINDDIKHCIKLIEYEIQRSHIHVSI